MAPGAGGTIIQGIRVDLRSLHDRWMALVFPRQLVAPHAVLGRWTPDTIREKLSYYGWGTIGAPFVVLLYPLVLLGYIARFYARRLDSTATRVGLLGSLAIPLLVWGLLSVVALFRFPIEGFTAVVAATVVATVSAGLAFGFARVGGRSSTVLFAYPFVLNAIFLPPVVAAFYSPLVARYVFPGSEQIAIWILDNLLYIYDINTIIRSEFALEGIGYVGMWFGLAVPLGWFLGVVVSLADLVRPKDSEGAQGSTTG